ncbi:HB1/ASXL restriction endonuclease-like protein with HTH domain [Roseivirga pacifica]|uniref:HB1, ASXL, restriction endonuclease HTH domain n=1 Tax=Roseivirga pacifica TaxID=1267423 RepID=A0A1I0RPR4_9BACT|nr:restriction endonuclease [Roseivirga pacifica]RKQ49922.1 HB1/ASXL restriction endonuclease-like protein with HTH domain [Roseivirga pacifica]SEW42684.1 HB1, ASXL, restriction endonuclease HTH domain [Roseivirga pacifica]
MKRLSFKDAAIKILKEAEEPLSAKEITQIALSEELIETSGATPEATMAAQLYTDTGKFKKVGKGLFALIKQTESANSPLLAIENQNSLVKQKLIRKIQEMDPFQFEFLVAELLRKIGYEKVEVTKRSGDKGIDVTGNLTVGGLTNVKTVIQVKRYKTGNNISGKYITQLRGSAEVDQRGLIITTSNFTKDAMNEAKATNKMPVALVNGQKLIDLLFKYKVGVKESIVSVFSIDSELFESELNDSTIKGSENKSRSIWPLPGGVYSYVQTLNQLLDQISQNLNSRENMVDWFIKSYDNVSSIKTANGYLNVPKNMGLIDFKDGNCILTIAGEEYHKKKDLEFLFETVSSNILAFKEIHQFLLSSDEAKADQEILEYVNENFDVNWSTLAQVNFRLLWLINIGKVEKTEEGYRGK